jgi:hypothetical protein
VQLVTAARIAAVVQVPLRQLLTPKRGPVEESPKVFVLSKHSKSKS